MSRVLPILFNTDMVRAIMDGRKTVTRRLIKHDTDAILNSPYHKEHTEVEDKQIISKLCMPPYQPGDILYVRETWCWCPCWDCGMDTDEHNCCDETARKFFNHDKREYGCYCYKASCDDNKEPSVDTWHPSIHMPKEAARIWLKVKDVRVERLQDITEEQAKAEGAKQCYEQINTIENRPVTYLAEDGKGYYVLGFKNIWNSTIKKSDLGRYGWEANPYVFVIEFERCEKPEDF